MNKQKRLFLLLAIIFLMIMLYISYDISRRTTFPGSKPQLKERLRKNDESPDQDTLAIDSLAYPGNSQPEVN